MNNIYYALTVMATAFLPVAAHAEVDHISCEGCTAVQINQAQMQYSRGLSAPALVDLYILNASGNTAKKVRITKDWDGGDACRTSPPGSINCQVFTNIQNLQVEPIVSDYLGYVREASKFNAEAVPITGQGIPINAFDDLNNPQKRIYIHNYLVSRFEIWTSVVNGLAGMGWNTFQTFNVKYADGSTARYTWDPVGKVYSPISISYKDRFGNIIPIKQEQLTEGRGGVVTTFSFGGGGPSDWASTVVALSNIGITMPAPPASPKSIICTSTAYGDGGVQVSCRWG